MACADVEVLPVSVQKDIVLPIDTREKTLLAKNADCGKSDVQLSMTSCFLFSPVIRMVLISSIISFADADVVASLSSTNQPLEGILNTTQVQIHENQQGDDPNDIRTSIESLDVLIGILSNVEASWLGISPGFRTVGNTSTWRNLDAFSEYQTLDSVNSLPGVIPMPCTAVATRYFLQMKEAWQERFDWANSKKNVCSCIGLWQHRRGHNVLLSLSNQIIEQLMVEEASECLHNQPNLVPNWRDVYCPEKCPTPDEMSALYLDSNVRLLDGLENYIYCYVECALNAMHSLDISVCYLFHTDPVARYILLDLIPFVASQGVKVRILFESMTVESQALRGVFEVVNSGLNHDLVQESFLYNLPPGSPPFLHAQKEFHCASQFVKEILDVASSSPNIDCKFWFAKDKMCNYRIKNHTKCHIFDGSMNAKVIAGGSNVAPRPGQLDTDFLVEGGCARMYLLHFENMWKGMNPCTGSSDLDIMERAEEKKENGSDVLVLDRHGISNVDGRYSTISKVLFLPSRPSSRGEDVILRCVLGGIKQAKHSIFMCMGHCNIPEAVAVALKAATDRGVKVSMITNSLYSCDLRGGQRDLFKSLERLLLLAPKVELVSCSQMHRQSNSHSTKQLLNIISLFRYCI